MWKRIYLYTVFVRIEILHNLLPYGTRLSPTSLGLGSQQGTVIKVYGSPQTYRGHLITQAWIYQGIRVQKTQVMEVDSKIQPIDFYSEVRQYGNKWCLAKYTCYIIQSSQFDPLCWKRLHSKKPLEEINYRFIQL